MVNMRYNNDKITPFNFMVILLVIIITLWILENVASENLYNNGICSCGGTFKYEQAVSHCYETRYLYICDKCGRTVKTFQYYPSK